MTVTSWFCEKCSAAENVEYNERHGVMSVIHAIDNSHHQASPDCNQDVKRLRIITGIIQSEELENGTP